MRLHRLQPGQLSGQPGHAVVVGGFGAAEHDQHFHFIRRRQRVAHRSQFQLDALLGEQLRQAAGDVALGVADGDGAGSGHIHFS
ncbi:hypothetical protein D3C76_1300430 [compost metagenome]